MLPVGMPYDFSMVAIMVHFTANPTSLEQLLMPPLQPLQTRKGEAFWLLIDHLMAPANASTSDWHPERLRMLESVVGIPCSFKGNAGVFYCYSWTDREWSLIMEWLTGMCGRLARLSLTQMQPEHPVHNGPRPGSHYVGTVERLAARVATGNVVLQRKAEASELPFHELMDIYGLRHIPNVDIDAAGRPLAFDLVSEQLQNQQLYEAWVGTGSLVFGDAENEWLLPIQPTGVCAGYYLRFSYRSLGMRVEHDYLKYPVVGVNA